MKDKSISHIAIGALVTTLGVGFLLDSLNVLDFGSIIGTWWPMVIIVVGLLSLTSNIRAFAWPLFIIAIGFLLQLRELGVVSFNVWSLIWPSIIIFVGLSLIFGKFSRPKEGREDKVDLFAAFSGIDSKNKSESFQGGTVTALFGGITLDLRDASIQEPSIIEVFTAFGGIEIRVPEDCRVKASGVPLFGGWDDKTVKPSAKDPKTLYIKGTCIFGGLEIKN